MAGTPDWPTTLKEPGFALAGAGLGPGAGTTAPPEQGPDWHPSPQWEVVFPQYPYMEQQAPCGQSPQTVPPKLTPQEPSVVTFAVDAEPAEETTEDGLPRTGSPEVVDEGGVALEAAAALTTELEDDVHPDTHPVPQCAGVFPHQPY